MGTLLLKEMHVMGLLDDLLGPLVTLTPQQKRDLEKKTQVLCIEQGRVARRAGLPKDHFSGRFKDNDMAIDWSNGWRWEDEAIRERERARKPSGRRKD